MEDGPALGSTLGKLLGSWLDGDSLGETEGLKLGPVEGSELAVAVGPSDPTGVGMLLGEPLGA